MLTFSLSHTVCTWFQNYFSGIPLSKQICQLNFFQIYWLPAKKVNNYVLPTEYVLCLLGQWNETGYASDFVHWQDNSVSKSFFQKDDITGQFLADLSVVSNGPAGRQSLQLWQGGLWHQFLNETPVQLNLKTFAEHPSRWGALLGSESVTAKTIVHWWWSLSLCPCDSAKQARRPRLPVGHSDSHIV